MGQPPRTFYHTRNVIDKRFANILFGYASAEEESVQQPELLLDGFLDAEGISDAVRNSSKFLVLGHKGSGKSAVVQHLRLLAETDPLSFVTTTYLGDFPYNDFAHIIRGHAEPEARYPTAWLWLILLSFFDSFTRDEGAAIHTDGNFVTALRALNDMGLLPRPDLRRVALVTSRNGFKLNIPAVLDVHGERVSQDVVRLPLFVDRLKEIASRFRSESRHLLMIDGLDDILTASPVQYDSLAALVVESSRLNHFFRANDVPAKVVVLCRTDLYERLPNANKNKIRQDAAIELDWYHDPRNPHASNLVRLTSRRTELTYPDCKNLFREFFPEHMGSRPILQFLLDHTRHTPRDFIQLLNNIQKFATGTGRLSGDQILSGVRAYSINYFLPEIRDELAGYTTRAEADRAFDLLAALHLRQFQYGNAETIIQKYGERFDEVHLHRVMTLLFECSAIGNVDESEGGGAAFTYKFRNRNSGFRPEAAIRVHSGLWKALNL